MNPLRTGVAALSAITLAFLALTNVTGTVGFCILVSAYLLAFARSVPRIAAIALLAYGLAVPWMPPSDIRLIFTQSRASRMFSEQLIAALLLLPGRPWSTPSIHLTPTSLARRLSRFEIRSHTIRIGHNRARGYHLAEFIPSFDRLEDRLNPGSASPTNVSMIYDATAHSLSVSFQEALGSTDTPEYGAVFLEPAEPATGGGFTEPGTLINLSKTVTFSSGRTGSHVPSALLIKTGSTILLGA